MERTRARSLGESCAVRGTERGHFQHRRNVALGSRTPHPHPAPRILAGPCGRNATYVDFLHGAPNQHLLADAVRTRAPARIQALVALRLRDQPAHRPQVRHALSDSRAARGAGLARHTMVGSGAARAPAATHIPADERGRSRRASASRGCVGSSIDGSAASRTGRRLELMLHLLENAAEYASTRISMWLASRVDPSRREWIDAMRAELDVIEGGWRKLTWVIGGVSLARRWHSAPSRSHDPASAALAALALCGRVAVTFIFAQAVFIGIELAVRILYGNVIHSSGKHFLLMTAVSAVVVLVDRARSGRSQIAASGRDRTPTGDTHEETS